MYKFWCNDICLANSERETTEYFRVKDRNQTCLFHQPFWATSIISFHVQVCSASYHPTFADNFNNYYVNIIINILVTRMPVIEGIWIQLVINFIFSLNQLCNPVMDKNSILKTVVKHFFSWVILNNLNKASAIKENVNQRQI